MSYDNPNSVVRREATYETVAGAAGVSAKFQSFQRARLCAVHCVVTAAGTTAGNSLIIKQGTTSIGQFANTTNTAGSQLSVTGLAKILAPFDQLTITNGTDATGKALITYEYQVEPDAVQSAY